MLNVKALLTKILLATVATDVSSQITVGSAWTVLQKRAVKIGNRVYFWIEANTSSYTYPYVYNFATFSNAIKPKYMNAFTGHTTDGSFTPKGILTFYTDGTTLKVSAQNNAGAYFFVNGSYEIIGGGTS